MDTDYVQDPARIHVYDPAIEPLSMVNMILCLLSQTGRCRRYKFALSR